MAGQVLRARIDLDAGNDTRVGEGFDEGRAILRLLADRFVVKDRAADGLAQTGRSHDQFSIGAARLLGLGNPKLGKPFVAGGNAFIHGQQAFVVGDQHSCGLDQCSRIRPRIGLHDHLRVRLRRGPRRFSNHFRASAASA